MEDEGALRRRDLTDSMLLLLLLRIGRLDEWLLSGLELRFLLKLVVDPLRYKNEFCQYPNLNLLIIRSLADDARGAVVIDFLKIPSNGYSTANKVKGQKK